MTRSNSAFTFPPPEMADDQGLLAYGGDLSAERLISAYESGVFPWFEEGQPILWWTPPERMVLYPRNFVVKRSLKQVIRNKGFEVTIDRSFDQVIEACSEIDRKDQDGTWITKTMKSSYQRLHQLGFAHSFETRLDGELVGGLYGVSLGRAFFGESMFSRASNASKVAFHALVQFALQHEFDFIDCQLYTDHLASLGAEEIPRTQFLQELKTSLAQADLVGSWSGYETLLRA